MPVEIPNPIRFDKDGQHHSYDPEAVDKFWRILLSVDAVFQQFRSRFIGKCSPVHFFWGSFDLAVTRFSGRKAPPREGADAITREAYSHEVSSVGFWPGAGFAGPAFYSYMAPAPQGFRAAQVHPRADHYDRPRRIHRDVRRYSRSFIAERSTARLLPKHLRSRCNGGEVGPRSLERDIHV